MRQVWIYEVNLAVHPDSQAAFDAWLPAHIEEVLAQAGFLSARLLHNEDRDTDGWVLRTVQYQIRDRQALDDYLAGPAKDLRGDGIERFGDHMRAERRLSILAREFGQALSHQPWAHQP